MYDRNKWADIKIKDEASNFRTFVVETANNLYVTKNKHFKPLFLCMPKEVKKVAEDHIEKAYQHLLDLGVIIEQVFWDKKKK